MQVFLQDFRYAVRQLRKSPGFTAVALLTLALGIGANTAIFSVANAVLLRALPYRDPDSLVLIWSHEHADGDNPRAQLSFTDIDDYRTQSKVFDNVVSFGDWSAVFSDSGSPERIPGMQVADGYFSLMRVQPLLGRDFLPEEQIDGKDQVVILSYGLWQRRFAGDPGIVGTHITLSERPYTVVGVAPKDFPALPPSLVSNGAQFYRPEADKRDDKERLSRHLRAIARLKPGVSVARAQAELDVINRRLAQQFPKVYATTGVRVVKLPDDIAGKLRPALLVLLGAVGFLLLIVCANVANLLLARSTSRQRELAVRTALGASQVRLVRQALTESLLLAFAGGGLGILLASWGTRLITAVGAKVIPQLVGVEIDFRVLGFTAGISLVTGVLFGLVPALHSSRLDVTNALKESSNASRGVTHGTVRRTLVISEIALSLMLLAGAGLLLRTLGKLHGVDPGFNFTNILSMSMGLPSLTYPYGSPKPVAFYHDLLDRVSSLPGIQSSAAVSILPLGADFDTVGTEIEGRVYGPGELPYPERYIVTPSYFKTLQISVLHGRAFSEADTADSPLVVMVSETAAQRWWPNQDPLGKRVQIPGYTRDMDHVWRTVVGVVNDVKQAGLDAPHTMQIYTPQAQNRNGYMILVVRTGGDPMTYATEVRREISALDKDLAVSDIASMDQVVSDSVASRRFSAVLLGAFAVLGLLLASVGVYGILAYSVAERTPEIGIRMALGAAQKDVLWLIVALGLRQAFIGVLAGTAAALALTRLMSSLLFEVSPADPATFVGAALLLSAVACVAGYIPARRAAKVDPIVALRHE
jgi:putative ABC transport system permease protein